MMEVINLPYSPSHFSETEGSVTFMPCILVKTSVTHEALSSLSV